ncbi:phosphoketolase family protein [Phycicoccus sp. M110.8]|uniref:phosphoketolase family protein n=1 Tax=Phycicoccus sp. M110.8 TaxID=3075433 RepID=UPI0028FD9F81|nr:phosphoketolase family protein [Phycicoccus sp. M110.8]MDU0315576.1 phosphoketolase family protein [Phycicoccus sp. M110.8]
MPADVTPGYAAEDLELDLRWWAAANYLTVGQIYLRENALLTEPLRVEHTKPRLLGHWGTSPGLSMVYALVNRRIRETGSSWLYVTGPGHGGPALVAAAWLEGTYSEVYPQVGDDAAGVLRLFRQFSSPGGVPSHVSVQTPGSIHEGGELGYALVHAAGAAFDHPDLVVACVVGDGEAETGPLAASWRLPHFLNPRRDGAVLPILHLNGYKIAGPTVLGRTDDEDVQAYLRSQGWDPVVVAGDDPREVFPAFREALARAHDRIREIQAGARGNATDGGGGGGRDGADLSDHRAAWPAIVLRTPKGWTGPAVVDGKQVEGTNLAHQVPLAGLAENPEHLRMLEEWMRGYRPDELFDGDGRLVPELRALAPEGDLRMSATPYANGGRLRTPLPMPELSSYEVEVSPDGRGRELVENTITTGRLLRDLYAATARPDGGGSFRLFSPDETVSNRLQPVFEVTDRCFMGPLRDTDDHLGPDGRVMEVLSEHLCQGWLEGYLLSGRHGMFATYEAFAMVSASMAVQHVKWLQHAQELPWRESVSSLNILLTSTCWRNDHNGFSHQGPGLIDCLLPLAPGVVRVFLPPDANTALWISEHCLSGTDHVNLIVVDKQKHLQYLSLEEAARACSAGASMWEWASTCGPDDDPDIVLACAGDVPTQEALAAAELLRDHVPDLKVRFVNVIDLMTLIPENDHPNGFSDSHFEDVFTPERHVVFAFHGYPRAIHQLIHGRANPGRFHVRGFSEQGTTTTPFDMVVLNRMSRFHLAKEVLRRARTRPPGWRELKDLCDQRLAEHESYIRENLSDLPDIASWTWQGASGTAAR